MIRAGARRALSAAASACRASRGATTSTPRLVPLPPQYSAATRVWAPLRGAAVAARRFASDAAAAEGASMAADAGETFEFRSETRRVLDIVTNSLYTERDIFLRELVSNSCDALEKSRLAAMSAGSGSGPLDIRISTGAGTLTIEDSGCGMTREELIANLGTIARSGTAEFVAKAGSNVDSASLIGRFGVGFYACFMVASRAEVFTRAAGGDPLVWRSDGSGSFSIARAAESDAPARGTKVVLHLKDDVAASGAYSTAPALEAILKRHSAFVPHPVFLDGARVNTLPAVWALRPSEVTEEHHTDFFRHLAGAASPAPAFRMHFSTDSPLALNALLYFPSRNDELTLSAGMERLPPGVSLYCRKVLIMRDAPNLLPQYLRFLKGVVDCEDLPLNISRETLQDSAIVRRLRELLTTRALKFLADAAKKDPAGYERWHTTMNGFIKEGICSDADDARKEALAKLLRHESSALPRGELTSLEAALERAKARLEAGEGEQKTAEKKIYYLVSQSREAAESSPYLEAFKARNIEVLLLFTPADEIVMKMMNSFQGARLVSAEEADLSAEAPPPASEGGEQPLSAAEMDTLCAWMHDGVLSGEVAGVRASERLTDSAAVLTGHMPESLRKLQLAAAGRMDPAAAAALMSGMNTGWLELNPKHPLIKRLAAAAADGDAEKAETAKLVAAQLADSARIAAGAMDDPRAMLKRLADLSLAALGGKGA